MMEYTITCQEDPSDDIRAVATVSGCVALFSHGSPSVYVSPDDARTFARGILALADEVDGGEVPAPEADQPFEVGDMVRTVRELMGLHRGRTGELVAVDPDHAPRYKVRFPDGDAVWAYDIEAPTEPAPSDVKVGDRVRITYKIRLGDPRPQDGKLGVVVDVDEDDENLPYCVRLDDGGATWAYLVELLSSATAEPTDTEPVSPPVTDEPKAEPLADWERELLEDDSAPSRAALLAQAADLMAGTDHYTASDLIELVNYLAGDNA